VDIRPLTNELSVGPQIALAELPAIAAAGFRSVICNRPDDEGADQPGFSEIERAAAACRPNPARSATSRAAPSVH
jgi:sulfide:quinone oxidoreductase